MHVIAALLLALTAAGPLAAEGSPLRLVRTISLPGVDGRIDHLAIDLDRQQLYIAKLGNDTLGVVDLFFDGESLARVGRMKLAGDADNVRYGNPD